LFNGYLVWRISISPIIITVGSLSLIYGIGLVLNSGTAVDNVPESFSRIGSVNVFGFSLGFVIFLLLCTLGWGFLTITRAGRHLYAIGGSREAATRVGIPVRRFVIGTFVVNGVLTGLGAVLLASRFGTGDVSYGLNLEIQVITAVILGGVAFKGGEGGMGGVLMAVMFLGVLESGIVALGVNPYFGDVVEGATLIAAVALEQLAREQRDRRQRALALADVSDDLTTDDTTGLQLPEAAAGPRA
jgi:ribose/xylose/arabinose/galactoside ABC-type transport system permease subunit